MNKFLLIILPLIVYSCKGKNDQGQPEWRFPAGICISFDDRSIEEWYSIRALLHEYGAKVTFFVTQFDSLTPSEIDKLKTLENDGHEIGSHGALHVVSEFYIKKNSYLKYLKQEIDQSIISMKKGGFNPTSFAYPYGAKYWFTDFLLLRKFDILRNVAPINKERDLTLIDEIYRPATRHNFDEDRTVSAIGIDINNKITRGMIRKAMKRAVDQHEVLFLFGHRPKKNPENNRSGGSYDLDIDFLRFILSEAKNNKFKFYRIKDLSKNNNILK